MTNKLQISSNWSTLDDLPLTKESLGQLFANDVPCVRHKDFLTPEECKRMVKIIEETEFGHYDPDLIFPILSNVGVSQFDYTQNMDKYFSLAKPAQALQRRFAQEAGVDIIPRVMDALHEASGLPVRMAREGEKEYFAGLLRVVDGNFIMPHADYGPHSDPGHEIGRISGQVTWNILLKSVPGGETLVHDRPWEGKQDDEAFQKRAPRYAYSPLIYQGRITKVVMPVQGDLTFFNSRNIHEVMRVDEWNGKKVKDKRFTVSSFVGYLPHDALGGPCLILWS